jgi:thioredoxin-dependent peroxiredoxin
MSIILKQGDEAPHFTAQNQHEQTITLAQYISNKVILFFYPKNETPACTTNACNLQDNFEFFTNQNIILIGISPDSSFSHKTFAEKHQFNFSLLADPQHHIINSYGTWGNKNLYGKIVTGLLRTTFIINENGIIQHVIKRVDTKNATQQIIKHLK